MYCNTLVRITGCRRQNCVAIQNCIATERQGVGQGRWGAQAGAGARRWACRAAAGAHAARRVGSGRHGAGRARAGCAGSRRALGVGARGRQQRRAGRAGQACGRALGARADARARGRAPRGVAGERGAAGWALLCTPGHASWASCVLVHPAWFSTQVFSTRYFPESLNEHCSL